MAKKASSTKKSTSSRATAAKKTTVKKTPVVAKRVSKKPVMSAAASVPMSRSNVKSVFPDTIGNIMLAEVVGTFILTMVALVTSTFGALFMGITLMVISFAIFAISGSHVNPAVTFGLWSMRKLRSVMLPVYWASQFLGAFLAVAVMNLMTNGQFVVNFSSILAMPNAQMFFMELIGTAVFMFGIAAVVLRSELSDGVKSLGIGMSLTVALVVAGSVLTQVQGTAYNDYQKNAAAASSDEKVELPHALKVKGATVNPAVAVAVTESTESQLMSGSMADGEKLVSRLSPEVILGALAGAALGGNLFMLIAHRPKNEI